jgi:hypothetical protein
LRAKELLAEPTSKPRTNADCVAIVPEQLGGYQCVEGWFVWFRFFGPKEPFFDKSWRLPDFELVK